MADIVRTLTAHVKLVAVGIGAVALFGGTATTYSLSDSSTPATHPTPNPHASDHPAAGRPSSKPSTPADDEDKTEPSARPTDTHGYCVSHAVAAAVAKGATGQDVAAAAHSCPKPGGAHGKSGVAHGHKKG